MIRRTLLVTAALCLAPTIASARDSSWLVCKGIADHGGAKSYLFASVLEHRAPNGSDRDLDVTIIYGANVSMATAHGNFMGAGAKIDARRVDGAKHTLFKGTVALDNTMSKLTLKGDLDQTYGTDTKVAMEKVTAVLTCEQLDDQAIGH